MEEFKPCPFCGADLTKDNHNDTCYIKLLLDGWKYGKFVEPLTLREAWNTRAE